MRANIHSARSGSRGVFSPRHADRDFDTSKDNHIDSSLTPNNYTWKCYSDVATFEQAEKEFYEKVFSNYLTKKNMSAFEHGHPDRYQTMDEYRRAPRTCPEQNLIYIGNKNDCASPEMLKEIFEKQLSWECSKFKNVIYLDYALHQDESGAPHIEAHKVWVYKNKDGLLQVGQNQALKAMGIERPDPSKPESKYNNAKQTYSKMCREHFVELCKEYGLSIEEPSPNKSKNGRDLEVYKYEQDIERLKRSKASLEREIDNKRVEVDLELSDYKDERIKELEKDISYKALKHNHDMYRDMCLKAGLIGNKDKSR